MARRHLLHQQAVGLEVQRAGGVEHEGVDGTVDVAAEPFGELPVARHAAPQGVEGDEVAGVGAGDELGEVSRLQGAHGEGLTGAAVERGGGVEDRAVHHALARSAHHDGGPSRRAVYPALKDPGQRGVGGDQVRQLVEHERTGPAAPARLGGEPQQERAPVRVLDIVESGEPPGHRRGQVAPLHGGHGSVGGRIQSVLAPRPLDEQPGLADPPPSPDDGEGAGLLQHAVRAGAFHRCGPENALFIMHTGIMPACIKISSPEARASWPDIACKRGVRPVRARRHRIGSTVQLDARSSPNDGTAANEVRRGSGPGARRSRRRSRRRRRGR